MNSGYTETFFRSEYDDHVMTTMANVESVVVEPITMLAVTNTWKLALADSDKYCVISRARGDTSIANREERVLDVIRTAPIGALLKNIRADSKSPIKGEHMIVEFKKVGINKWKPRSFFMIADTD